MNILNVPHGGELIERCVHDDTHHAELLDRAIDYPSVLLDETASRLISKC